MLMTAHHAREALRHVTEWREAVDARREANLRVIYEAPPPHPHTVAVLRLAAHLHLSADAGEEP